MKQKSIRISDFDYDLPQQFIAQKPLEKRNQSKLLVYKEGEINHKTFNEIVDIIPEGAQLIFNNTKVMPARLFVTKPTGALIQVFLLSPSTPYTDVERTLELKEGPITWNCMIGNAKRWKEGEESTIVDGDFQLTLTLINKEKRLVTMNWSSRISFSEVIDRLGNMPLPPYIKREAQEADDERYQTVYAKKKGAVAAPTAGLHFTNDIVSTLKKKQVEIAEVTLHVGSGTFKPVDEDFVWNHPMHEEYYQVSLETIRALANSKPKFATGTTSLRTLETLYWVGIQLNNNDTLPFNVTQHKPYLYDGVELSYEESMKKILSYMESSNISEIVGQSGIMIMPGYEIRSVQGLITNFHLPKSTLLLLIAAMVGDDWRRIYQKAKESNYRFLSYGDSSILFKSKGL